MVARTESLLWAPLIAASIHVFEEFAWPGGFPHWYKKYRAHAKSVNRRFLFILNAGLLITLLEAALAGGTPNGAAVGMALLLTFSALLFSNGCWHLWASYKSHSYSPGAISGTLLYLPLPLFEYYGWMQTGRASQWTAILSFLIGSSYPIWSELYHKVPDTESGTIPGK